jgi:hypothetical protein
MTAVHDSAASWAGLGSAVTHLYHQTAVRGSILGVLYALLYLGNILVLHITTPALFSVEAINSTRELLVATQDHLPVHNWSTDITADK